MKKIVLVRIEKKKIETNNSLLNNEKINLVNFY